MEESSYPLEQLATIKLKKLEEAEKVLRQKKEALEQERITLHTLEKARDEVKNHRTEKLEQLREGLDQGLPALKIDQMRIYLKIVDEKLSGHEKKVSQQKKVVASAEEEVKTAREQFLKKQQDVEKLKLHKNEWSEEKRKEESRKETVESDELGSISHHRRHKKKGNT